MNRKNFLFRSAATAGAFLVTPALYYDRPNHDPALIKEFVGKAHSDFDKVKAMLAETPDLLHAVNNLGAWDWEDAIGAAGHVGHRELTLLLLEKGARPTICTAAMLGKTEIVKAFITAYPYMKNAVGPHRIPLMAHARKGGKEAEPVVEYLKSIGLQ